MFAEYVENARIGQEQSPYQFILILIIIVAGIIWLRFIFQTKKTNRDVGQMQSKFDEQQKKIDELKRELEEMKRKSD